MSKQSIKGELERDLDELRAIRDEVRVKLHLASMDAKDYWKQLESRIEKVEERVVRDGGERAVEAVSELIEDVASAVRKFRHRLIESA